MKVSQETFEFLIRHRVYKLPTATISLYWQGTLMDKINVKVFTKEGLDMKVEAFKTWHQRHYGIFGELTCIVEADLTT